MVYGVAKVQKEETTGFIRVLFHLVIWFSGLTTKRFRGSRDLLFSPMGMEYARRREAQTPANPGAGKTLQIPFSIFSIYTIPDTTIPVFGCCSTSLRLFFDIAPGLLRQAFDPASTLLRNFFDCSSTILRLLFDKCSTVVRHLFVPLRHFFDKASTKPGDFMPVSACLLRRS
jgi:hypothetical protein